MLKVPISNPGKCSIYDITPQRAISFVSKRWGGRVSDRHITENSSFLQKHVTRRCSAGRQGVNVADCLGAVRATLHIQAYTKGKDQLTAFKVEQTRNTANVRIHVERVIGCVRQKFECHWCATKGTMLKKDGIVMLDAIVRVCYALMNMSEGIIPFE